MLSVICESVYMRIKGGHAANQYARRFPFNQVRVNGARTKYHIPNTKCCTMCTERKDGGIERPDKDMGRILFSFVVVVVVFLYF